MSRLRLAKINTPSAPPATTAEIFYSTTDGKLEAIDEAGNVVTLGGLGSTRDYRLIRVFWQTTSGTYGVGQTIAMTQGTRALYVECQGAQGGGGSANITGASQASAAGGGAGGAYVASWIVIPAPGTTTYAVTIGGSGAAGTAGGAGGTGGDTTFGAVIIAKGGGGGGAGTAAGAGPTQAVPGIQQAGNVGDYTINGQRGGWGVVWSATVAAAGNGGGSVLLPAPNVTQIFITTSGTATGRANGDGGANLASQAAAAVGIAGAAGVCRIWEYA